MNKKAKPLQVTEASHVAQKRRAVAQIFGFNTRVAQFSSPATQSLGWVSRYIFIAKIDVTVPLLRAL